MASLTVSEAQERPGAFNPAVRAFLECLPSPEDHYCRPFHELLDGFRMAMRVFLGAAAIMPETRRRDPDFLLLQESIRLVSRDPNHIIGIYNEPARIAMLADDDPNDHSPMAKQLRYLR